MKGCPVWFLIAQAGRIADMLEVIASGLVGAPVQVE